jgi:hypothetical protein
VVVTVVQAAAVQDNKQAVLILAIQVLQIWAAVAVAEII